MCVVPIERLPLPFVAQLGGEILDALRLLQDAQSALDHLLARRRDAREIASLAHEDLEAELVLEQLDLLADARLRGVQLLRRRRDVQPALGDGGEIAKLVQLHRIAPVASDRGRQTNAKVQSRQPHTGGA